MITHFPWFRLYSEMVDDSKLRLLAFEDRWHYVALLCLKCQGILDSGADLTLMRRHVAVKLGVDTRTLDDIERRLVAEHLIEPDTLQPLQWDKRQFVSDTDPTNSKRQAEWRERQKTGQPATKAGKHEYTPEFEQAWAAYPKRPGANKLESFKAWKSRLAQNVAVQVMLDGTNRYAAFCRAMGTEPQFVKQPATFFGPNLHFTEEWRVPIGGVAARGGQRSTWAKKMTGNNGGTDDRPGDSIDVDARRV